MTLSFCACGNSSNEKTYTQSEVDAMMAAADSDNKEVSDTISDTDTEGDASDDRAVVSPEPTASVEKDSSADEKRTVSGDTSVANPYTGSLDPSSGLEFESNGDGTCNLVGIGSCTDSNIIIPATNPNGETVVRIEDNAFAYSDKLESFIVLNSQISIGEYAFYNTGHKANYVFEDCEMDIEDSAFSGCKAVAISISTAQDLELPSNAIAYCDKLENVIIVCSGITINDYAFYNDDDLAEIMIETNQGSVILEDSAFSGSDAESITINCSSIEIGDNAFAYNENLETVTIDGTIAKKGSYMFYRCPDDIVITIGGENYTAESIEE